MTEATMNRTWSYRPGDDVPDWLLTVEPETPDPDARMVLRFDSPALVIEIGDDTEGMYLLIGDVVAYCTAPPKIVATSRHVAFAMPTGQNICGPDCKAHVRDMADDMLAATLAKSAPDEPMQRTFKPKNPWGGQ